MKTYYQIEQLQANNAVALGFFDGMHLAHKQVIQKAVEFKSHGLTPTVLTFRMDVPYKNGIKTIISDKVKLELLELCDIEQVVMPPFSDLAELEDTVFFREIVLKKLGAKAVICGYDYRYGKGAQGTVDKLELLCKQNGMEFCMVEQFKKDNLLVSSTAIRGFLQQGDIEQVNCLLGYSYYVKSVVNHGKALGRTIGFPTINQQFEKNQITPLHGVYHTRVTVDGIIYEAVSNVGKNPTTDSGITPRLETFIIGYDGDLYDREIRVEFVSFIRAEQKFGNLDALKNAIANDVSIAIQL